MTPSDDGTLDELLYSRFHDSSVGRAEQPSQSSIFSGKESSTLSPPLVATPLICGGCGKRVCDHFVLLAAGQAWHGACLRCSQCQCELQTHPSLYCKEGNIYCQQDYCRLFGVGRCTRCHQPIPSSALVMRSGEMTFHPQCFSCQECDVTLLPGNLYCVEGQSLFCQSHYHGDSGTPLCVSWQQSVSQGDGEEPVSSPEPRLDERARGGGAHRRVKRIRTCFRSEQLRALESYFAQKHNPDGKDWTSLSSRTGLPKRVLQVWFQNARAKFRRTLSSDTPQTALSTAETMTTPPHHQTSTIDELELALLTAPVCDSPFNPVELFKDSTLLGYNTHNAHVLASLEDIDRDPGIILNDTWHYNE
ncbi:LIM/homeobox protein Awh-like isoform X2 [Brachyhypopomus gauderio]|uniref:LIM/homeobox protein Awh-like isoform X2 n=1 Tax=Brachyhypopomus gauderio TaxID=698409 RepID=UPI00404168B4